MEYGDADDFDEAEPDPRQQVAGLIARMEAFTAKMPIVAHLRPYRNPHAPDLSYPAVVLTDLFADQPGRGAGSAWLAELVRQCDEAELTLYVDADGPRSRDFYLARGFTVTTGRRDHQLVHWPPDPEGLSEAIARDQAVLDGPDL